jgi:hypothetical protein
MVSLDALKLQELVLTHIFILVLDTMWPQFLLEVLPKMGWSGEAKLCKLSPRNSIQDGNGAKN